MQITLYSYIIAIGLGIWLRVLAGMHKVLGSIHSTVQSKKDMGAEEGEEESAGRTEGGRRD